ncbi:phosphotransferase [Pseudonocardia spinosispora]|uniref:phosphotransferase n=1 Tax=Pseudonocardia spinosispora TaxID=103441 RepID=UPI000414A6DC|nr:phosphotransferase [Pseudonocardia spinosispora]
MTTSILTPTELEADWFTELLRGRGIDATVAGVDREPVGTGQLAETRRFTLRYAGGPPPGAPAALIGKFTSDNDVAAETGHTLGIYRSEVMFYRELAEGAGIRTPKVYAAEINDQGRFLLLLEDLAPARAGNQLDGCTLDEVRRGLSEAALLHAAYWDDAGLAERDWVYVPEGAQGFYTTELVERSWKHVCDTYDGRLPAEVVEVCARYVAGHERWNRRRGRPRCLTHNDFRPDNMLLPDGGGRVALVDWQTVSFLEAGMDAAYFLGGALDRETRRAREPELLRHYHDDLQSLGVTGYPYAEFHDDYRHYTFAALTVGMGATLLVKRTERGDQMLMRMICDAAYHVLDTGALELLG